ncbi:Acyl-N-acyltransferase [Cordyceps militaris]|uniref:Acyl-N-acyltransferase n=1 Tax=Cordyceps militaris TaxID=73501 RepID=A0A2H4SGF7_CORMI|nr:Acyl-N-acyltransferase [Cordyceps militaris]
MSTTKPDIDLQLHVAKSADEASQAFGPMCQAFGVQTQDTIFIGTSPGWDTPVGRQRCAARLGARFANTTTNLAGKPNTVFLLATTAADPGASTGDRVVAGMAVWEQCSSVPGHGNVPTEGAGMADVYPDDPAQQQYWTAILRAMHSRRWEVARSKAAECPPAVMALDICAVDPRFQGRGIGQKLVEWGLQEAKARGDLEAVTEASVMGRRVYLKLGFEQEGGDIEYNVDASLSSLPLPSNVFLRTRKP